MPTRRRNDIISSLSKSLSTTETSKLESILQNPTIRDLFEDPLTANKLLDSFNSPTFRNDFFEDPLTAMDKIGIKSMRTGIVEETGLER